MSQTDEEETSEIESFILDQDSFASDHSALASKLALLAATGQASLGDNNGDDQISVDAETQARLEALLEAAGIGKLSTSDGKAFADPEVLKRLSSSVSSALDDAAAALSKMKTENETANDNLQERSLAEACSVGDVGTVKKLLCEGRSANETTEDGESLLSLACSAGYYELAEVLLAMHANVEDCGAKGDCTPLMEAASGGFAEIVQLLLSRGADVNATSTTGNTALTYACCGGYEDVVKLLVGARAELECHNENGHTPLMEAASGGHVAVASILLNHGAGINTHSNEFKESALTLACYKGHLQMVRFLLQAGADQEHKTDEMHTALMEASMDGHVEVARLLLDSGAQVNMPADSFESPLTLAACGGHVELAELLIERGASLEEVNDEGYTPLMEAAREGHEEMVALLLAKNANVNAKTEETQETALTLACCGGFLECAELLVRAGGNIETGCSTPLMEAAQEGQLEIVKFLIQQNANVNATTTSGDTALSFACEHGHTDVADVLLAAGADLEHETEGGRTPLMKAARAGHFCTVQFLISRGADVNRTTKNNEHSVLSLACVCGHVSVVELLLCQGADPTLKLKDGSTMLLESSKGGHTSIVQLLLDFPHNLMSLPPEASQVASPTPEQITPRVPTQSLPMVVPPPEPDQSPQLGLSGAFDQIPDVPDGSEKTKNMKLAVDKDVAFTVEKFLQSMASDAAAGKARTAESIVEEAQGKLTELEQRIKEAIEKNAQLKNIEMMQNDQLTKEKVEELYKTREEQIHKKQKILEELQKVERELQLKTQQQLKQHYLDMKQAETNTQRGKPDGEDNESIQSLECVPVVSSSADYQKPPKDTPVSPQLSTCPPIVTPNPPLSSNTTKCQQTAPKINNGSSGSLPQAVKENDESYCQCVHHPCTQLSHPATTDGGSSEVDYRLEMQQGLPATGFATPSSLVSYPHLDIDGYTESNHDTPLTLACAGGHEDLVQLLISRQANIEHRDKKGFTPIILAATAGHVGVVSILLQANSDIEAQSERTKDTPLSLACSGGRMEVVELLLNQGANKEHRNVSDYTPLSLAASGGYVNIIKLLLNHGAEINSRTGSKLGISPLMLAAMNGHTQAVQLLLDMGADINAQIETNRNTALTLACFQGRHEVVSLLVDRKANVEHRAKTGLTPLMEAASGGYAEVGRVLLDKGADPNAPPVPSSRDTALTIAADKGHYRFCELVLSRGAQVEVKNKKGNTPLWLACNGGHLDVVMLLVGKGADVNAADNRNVIPLMAAFRKGHVQVVKWLAKEVSQFPSDAECMRYIATITDRELLKRSHTCMECIAQAKERQAQEANEVAKKLLEELETEKDQEKNRRERQARKREKRRKKRKQKTGKKSDGDPDNLDDDCDEKADDVKELEEATEKMKISDERQEPTAYPGNSTPPTRTSEKQLTSSLPGQPLVSLMSDDLPSQSTASASSNKTICGSSIALVTSSLANSDAKKREDKKKGGKESSNTSSSSESSPRNNSRKVRKSPPSQQRATAPTAAPRSAGDAPSTTKAAAAARPPPGGHRGVQATPSPGKRTQRREEGWKEVPSRKFASSAARRILVNSNLISRVIGRGGSNINAIREVTGAHIDIDKQRKGGLERTVTIKGAAESIKRAYQLITALINEDRTDQEITSIISKVQAEAAQNAAAKQQPVSKPPMTVVAAPMPTRPAWTVPPSIVAQATSQPRAPATATSKPSAWATTTTATSSGDASEQSGVAAVDSRASAPSSTSQNRWSVHSPISTTTSSVPTIETVKKALFVTSQSAVAASNAASTASPAVSFTPKGIDKPIQPVAPMVSTKVTSSSRISSSSYGPVGSAISQNRPQIAPFAAQHSAIDRSSAAGACQPKTRDAIPTASSDPMIHLPTPQGPMSPTQPQITAHNQSVSQGVNQTAHVMAVTGQGQVNAQSGATPRTPVSSYANHNAPNVEMKSSFGPIGPVSAAATPSYSPFSSSFTPSAGPAGLWNNEIAISVSSYQGQPLVNGLSEQAAGNCVDQSKAPGYRGGMKSPIVENGVIGGGPLTDSSNLDNPSPAGSQQGSPSQSANDLDVPNKPRPIGTERAHHRRANPPLPRTTVVGQPASNIWSYDKLPPAQIGVDHFDPHNTYSNWPSGPKDGTNTTSTTNKPQVTTSEIDSLKSSNLEQPSPIINQPYPNASTMGIAPQPNRLPAGNSRFNQPNNNNTVGRLESTQAPIGSHLSSSVGVVGPQQMHQHHSLQPIGSHLGSGGGAQMRNNPSFQSIQHRGFPGSNPGQMQQQQQQQQQTRYPMPYYMQQSQQQQQQPQQQNDVSRYVPSMTGSEGWQHQASLYQRHPNQMNPYQQKELQNASQYGSLPNQFGGQNTGADANLPINQHHLHGAAVQGFPQMQDLGPAGYTGLHPDTQGGFLNEAMHQPYFDSSSDYIMRGAGMGGGSYGVSGQSGSAEWDPSANCQPGGYHAMNGGRSIVGSQNGLESDASQAWKRGF